QRTCVPMEAAQPGDMITTGTEIRVGDLVILVEKSPHQFVQMAVSEAEAALYSGPKYRVSRGAGPGTIAFIPVGGDTPTVVVGQSQAAAAAPATRKPWWKFWG